MHESDRETVILDRGGSGAGIVVGIIVAVAILAIGYLVFFNGAPTGGTVDVDVPAVSVDVVPDGQ
ncbi:hypothetical protein SAMN06295905_1849 [Devosia lucknowensis]|uniref:Uncharacterized protein n=1 Tax=Devosia lucknowensis TaxID=1096929 RepID=A0A1Y6FA72_9HYPH|nr:hypothetical protein [Devosia lucknowensis]SMQ70250.1 hypothetical protein SAMN06295905_1849 [Devosia lucknowensis]